MASFVSRDRPSLSSSTPTVIAASASSSPSSRSFTLLLSNHACRETITAFLPAASVLALGGSTKALVEPCRRNVGHLSVDMQGTDSNINRANLVALLRSNPGIRSLSYHGRTDILTTVLQEEPPCVASISALAIRHNGVFAEGLQLLVGALQDRCLPHLTSLDLRDNMLGETGAAEIAAALLPGGGLATIRDLRLDNNHIDSAGAKALGEALIQAGAAPSLRRLTLSANDIEADGMMEGLAPAFRGSCQGLMTLDLSDCPFGTAGAEAFSRSIRGGGLPALRGLRLGNCEMGAGGVQHLAFAFQQGARPSLQHLYLHDCYMGVAGATALTSSIAAGAFPCLQALDLSANGIKPQAVGDLIGALAARCHDLRELRLAHNPLGSDENAVRDIANHAIRGGKGLPALEILDLTWTDLNSAGLKHLAASLLPAGTVTLLRELYLSGNDKLGAEDIKILAHVVLGNANACPRLKYLEVSQRQQQELLTLNIKRARAGVNVVGA